MRVVPHQTNIFLFLEPLTEFAIDIQNIKLYAEKQ